MILYCGDQKPNNVGWLYENSEQYSNIHKFNRCFCETTAMWFMWKNYEQIANTDYIQLSHYRRTLDFSDYELYDVVHNNPMPVPSVKQQMNISHDFIGHNYDRIIERIYNNFPNYYQIVEDGMNCKKFYFKNLFIMKRDIFFELCKFSFDIFNIIHDTFPVTTRDGAFFMERITSCFIANIVKHKNTKGVDAICNC